MHETEPKKDMPAGVQRENLEELPAEIECWLIDDFVELPPRDPRAHLGVEPV
jgi:hypothetical protein